jgi:hypothetical protein
MKTTEFHLEEESMDRVDVGQERNITRKSWNYNLALKGGHHSTVSAS